MKKANELDFSEDFMVYVIDNEETECFSYNTYLKNKKAYENKVLIIAHADVPVYFRLG